MGDFVKAKFMHQTTVEKKKPHVQWAEKKHGTLRRKYHAYTRLKKKIPSVWKG